MVIMKMFAFIFKITGFFYLRKTKSKKNTRHYKVVEQKINSGYLINVQYSFLGAGDNSVSSQG